LVDVGVAHSWWTSELWVGRIIIVIVISPEMLFLNVRLILFNRCRILSMVLFMVWTMITVIFVFLLILSFIFVTLLS
jgi:hypothetical protein